MVCQTRLSVFLTHPTAGAATPQTAAGPYTVIVPDWLTDTGKTAHHDLANDLGYCSSIR